MKFVEPAGMSHWTVNEPSGLPVSERRTLLARVRAARKLIAEDVGAGVPVGKSRRSPLPLAPVTVTLMATAWASGGIAQLPEIGKSRVAPLPASAGPPRV